MFYVELLKAKRFVGWTLASVAVICTILALLSIVLPDGAHIARNDGIAYQIVGWASGLASAILGTILGASLLNENCHLELVGTRPISRPRYALGVLLIDVACLILLFAITFSAGYVIASLLQAAPLHVVFDEATALETLQFATFPVAWFGLAQALTAGIRTSATGGWVTGLSWPIAEGLSILAALPLSGPVHALLSFLNLANPIGYWPFWEIYGPSSPMRSHYGYGASVDILALVAIALVGTSIATMRWRRVEA